MARRVIGSLIAVVIMLGGGACHSKTGKSSSTNSPHQKSVTDVSVLDTWFPDLSFLESDVYYIGTVDSVECMVQLTTIHRRKVDGNYYLIGHQAEVEAVAFQGTFKRNKGLFQTNDGQFDIRLLYHTADNDTIYGQGVFDKRDVAFCFRRYQMPAYHTYQQRYLIPSFPCKVIKDVCYGSADGYWASKPMTDSDFKKLVAQNLLKSKSEERLPLTMDIYMPDSDEGNQRPLLMLIHGGGFYFGDKTDTALVKWSKHFASLGYVVASINYRMGFQLNKRSIERCGYAAVQDAHAAMRYLVAHQKQYKIDTSNIFVGGTSAGAITGLNLAFMRNEDRPTSSFGGRKVRDLGTIESSGNTFPNNFKIRAVADMWGAISDVNMLYNAHTDIISFHGDSDRVVPYGCDVPFKGQSKLGNLFFDKMFGSSCIVAKAKELGYRQELYTFHGAGHAPHLDKQNRPNAKCDFIQDKMTNFFFKELLPAKPAIEYVRPQYYKVNMDKVKETCWQIEGGFVLATTADRVRVVWLKDAPIRKLSVAGCLTNGTAFETSLTVK